MTFCFEELYNENVERGLIKSIKDLLSYLYDFYTNNDSRCNSGSQKQSFNVIIFPSELEKRNDIVDYKLAKVPKLSNVKRSN